MFNLSDDELSYLAQEDSRTPLNNVEWFIDKLLPKDMVTTVYGNSADYLIMYLMMEAAKKGATIDYYDFQNAPDDILAALIRDSNYRIRPCKMALPLAAMLMVSDNAKADIVVISPAEYVITKNPSTARQMLRSLVDSAMFKHRTIILRLAEPPQVDYINDIEALSEDAAYVLSPYGPASVVLLPKATTQTP